ncbi:hypothetical protein LJB86_04920 [Deltaproteobacteria bacterium OttesenSCG-928-M10]|nr:hypothetical protein [Deltaproteobacteria bacterium OttesenSCG-928-M10]
MSRYALIENNAVANIIEASGPDVLPGVTLLPAHGWTAIGDVLVNGQLPLAPSAPEPDPEAQRQAALAAVDAELAALDTEYYTDRMLANLALGDEFALSRHQEHEEKAAPLRQKRADLAIGLKGDEHAKN